VALAASDKARSPKSRYLRLPFVLLAILGALAAVTHSLWLGALGKYLILSDPPAHADYAVVLAGDFYGRRILAGGELVRQGFVRKALVSGPRWCYGQPESDLAVNFAVKQGYPEDYFLKFPDDATSTRDEAAVIVPELRRLGAHSFLLVTSDYHTRRAGRYFRASAAGLDMRVIAVPDQSFHWDSWWRSREAQKIVYMEWSKTLFSYLGM
jgi:uncharacterized SAM-binding protein YcdF (DUF218 family)